MKQFNLLFIYFLCAAFSLSAQKVTTLATNTGIDDALIFDAEGNILGANYNGSAIFKLKKDGSVSVFSDGFNTPNGMARSSDGTLYMADNLGSKIYRILANGTSQVFVNYPNPSGLLFEHDSDTLLVAGYQSNLVSKVAPDGSIKHWISGGQLSGPVGMCYDDEHRLYLANFDNRRIFRVSPAGTLEFLAQAGSSGWLGFLAYAKGYLYATLINAHKIYRTDLAGNGQIILGSTAGSVDGDAATAKFNGPNGILVSPSQDTIYVSEYNTFNIRVITDLLSATSTTQKDFEKLAFNVSPNPADTEATITFNLPGQADITLSLLDAGGQLQRQIANGSFEAGRQTFKMDLDDLSPGVFYVVLQTGDGSSFCRKLVKIK